MSKVEKVISLAWLEIVDVDGTEKKVEMCILHLVCITAAMILRYKY